MESWVDLFPEHEAYIIGFGSRLHRKSPLEPDIGEAESEEKGFRSAKLFFITFKTTSLLRQEAEHCRRGKNVNFVGAGCKCD